MAAMVEAAKLRWLVRKTRVRFLVPDLDATQEQIGSAFAGQFVEKDDLVAPDGAARGQGAAFHDAIVGVVLHASDEEDAVSVERGKPGIVVVAAVEDHDGSGVGNGGWGRCGSRARARR